MPNAYGTNICIQCIWLRSIGDRIQVLVRLADQDYIIINEYAPLDEMTISHSVSALGIQEALKDGPVKFEAVDDNC